MLVILNSQAFSCALCALMIPTAHIYLDLETKESNLTSIKIEWIFSQNFTNLTKESYDLNKNSKLEDDELEMINKAFLDYVEKQNFLMSFEFYDMPDGKTKKLDGEFKNPKTKILDDKLVFEFEKDVSLELIQDRVLKVMANDVSGYFKFTFLNVGNENISDDMFVSYNSNLNAVFARFEKGQAKENVQDAINQALKEIDKTQKTNFIESRTVSSLESLKTLFRSSEGGLNLTLTLSIIIISFIYGFFHAAGPGHAKVLTTSYFMANGGSYLKSFLFALKIGFFHVIGSFLLVVVSMFVTGVISNFLTINTFVFTTKISAIIIILVVSYIFVSRVKSMAKESTHCLCCDKNLAKSEWFIALSAAIVPCAGTILVFLLAFNLGSYLAAFISAIFMGLGMASVIFIAAVFGASINKFTSVKFENLKLYIEFLALFVMLSIGIFMFIMSDKLGVL